MAFRMAYVRAAALIVSCTLAAGCIAPDAEDASEGENLGLARLAEVFTCPVNASGIEYAKEMVITATSVVDDNCRTTWNSACTTDKRGKWTFGHVMQQIAGGDNAKASTLILKWLESFEETPSVNGQVLSARTKIRAEIINPWRQASGCAFSGTPKVDNSPCPLDLTKAPFRLLAIVNRMDLRDGSGSLVYGGGSAGEGRLVYGFTRMDGTKLNATVVLEYKLPTTTWSTLQWAQKWHELKTTAAGETYNVKLQAITDQFVKANAVPANPNGSAIAQVRTNEEAFDPSAIPVIELREQKLQCRPNLNCANNDKLLLPSVVVQTPRNNLDMSTQLREYMNANVTSILSGNHVVPTSLLGGVSRPLSGNPFGGWIGDGPLDFVPAPDTEGDVRRLFSVSTCNGCHSADETGTNKFHVSPRDANVTSTLSPFLSGPVNVTELLEGEMVSYNEAERRKCEFQWLLNSNSSVLTVNSGRSH